MGIWVVILIVTFKVKGGTVDVGRYSDCHIQIEEGEIMDKVRKYCLATSQQGTLLTNCYMTLTHIFQESYFYTLGHLMKFLFFSVYLC